MQSIADIYRHQFQVVLLEEVHPELQEILDSDIHKHYKFNTFTKKIRDMVKNGQDTGLTDDKPKKGSSRAVLFHKDPHQLTIDGVETSMPTVLKVAFSGTLDKHLPHGEQLLGEAQNQHEASLRYPFSILQHDHGNEWHTNEHGFLPPMIDFDPEGKWNHVAKVEPINAKDFRTATTNEDFPKGISHAEFHDALLHHFNVAHGDHSYSTQNDEKLACLQQHPLVEKALDMCLNTDTHPGDFHKANMGLWTHPVTGEKHVVASDAGFSKNVMRLYNKARKIQGHRR